MGVIVRPTTNEDHQLLSDLLVRRWTSPQILIDGDLIDASRLPGFLAMDKGELAGAVTVIKREREWEILTLDSLHRWGGIGTSLLDAVVKEALEYQIPRLLVRTSNDNLDAFRFYQRRRFRLEKVVPDVIDEERKLKPEIPLSGLYGIPLHDEVIFSRDLREGE
ncbi:GNAT family N-acetyltransferase [Flexibacterium corallicola]|uniref:GNAT family N-acetyltransferase n=1 Tax=Flexibacterium corallicola TaxID=3037259 RepID=UPI00286F1D94|nr:GNAT family N-acetyltransferase [Pseudovibrio sp. M1P-2-3]